VRGRSRTAGTAGLVTNSPADQATLAVPDCRAWNGARPGSRLRI